MLEILIEIFIVYSIAKFLYHWLIQGHPFRDVVYSLNREASTISYTVVKKRDT